MITAGLWHPACSPCNWQPGAAGRGHNWPMATSGHYARQRPTARVRDATTQISPQQEKRGARLPGTSTGAAVAGCCQMT